MTAMAPIAMTAELALLDHQVGTNVRNQIRDATNARKPSSRPQHVLLLVRDRGCTPFVQIYTLKLLLIDKGDTG